MLTRYHYPTITLSLIHTSRASSLITTTINKSTLWDLSINLKRNTGILKGDWLTSINFWGTIHTWPLPPILKIKVNSSWEEKVRVILIFWMRLNRQKVSLLKGCRIASLRTMIWDYRSTRMLYLRDQQQMDPQEEQYFPKMVRDSVYSGGLKRQQGRWWTTVGTWFSDRDIIYWLAWKWITKSSKQFYLHFAFIKKFEVIGQIYKTIKNIKLKNI